MILLAFDPGFDVTGWAVFDVDRVPTTLQEAVGFLAEAGDIVTRTGDSSAVRLSKLGNHVHHLRAVHNPDAVVIEEPAYAGDYGNNRGRRASTNKLYMAIGAILSRTLWETVLSVRASTTPKATRHELLANAAEMASKVLPTGPRGGARKDAWDAVWIGCLALLERSPSLASRLVSASGTCEDADPGVGP